MFTHVSQGTSVVVARRDESSDVVVNIKRLLQREGGERCNRPILAKYIGGSRNCICGESRTRVWSAEGASVEAPQVSSGVGRGCPLPHFGGILAVNFKLYSMNKTVKIHKNPGDTSEYDAIKKGKQ